MVSALNADAPALLTVRATADWPEGWDGAGTAPVTSCPRTAATSSTYLVPLLQAECRINIRLDNACYSACARDTIAPVVAPRFRTFQCCSVMNLVSESGGYLSAVIALGVLCAARVRGSPGWMFEGLRLISPIAGNRYRPDSRDALTKAGLR